MLSRTTTFAFLIGAACVAGSALADNYEGVEVTPFGTGGTRFTVSMPSFNIPNNIGQVVPEGYKIPFSSKARNGCFVGSPALGIGHHDGDGQFIPSLHVTWQGVFFDNVGVWPNVFRLEVRIKGADGIERPPIYTDATAGSFQLTPLFKPTPDSTLFRGEYDQSLAGFHFETSADVKEDDEIHVSICDLTTTSSMTIRQLIFQSFPHS
jgi:hypothetical protein